MRRPACKGVKLANIYQSCVPDDCINRASPAKAAKDKRSIAASYGFHAYIFHELNRN